jgi:hypothetical protein
MVILVVSTLDYLSSINNWIVSSKNTEITNIDQSQQSTTKNQNSGEIFF